MMPYGWNDGGWGIFWMVATMVAMVAIVWAIVVVFVRPSPRDDTATRDAKDVLDERFAKGEIDEDEYRQRLDVLDQSNRQPTHRTS